VSHTHLFLIGRGGLGCDMLSPVLTSQLSLSSAKPVKIKNNLCKRLFSEVQFKNKQRDRLISVAQFKVGYVND